MEESEPWLRGPLDAVPAHVMPVFFSFQQVRENLAQHISGVDPLQIWCELAGRHSLGFHLKHIAGSVGRLTSYLTGDQLSDAQLSFLRDEHISDLGLADLLALVDESLKDAEQKLLQIKAESLFEPRFVGRQQLPTTVIGLLVHVCEHTQRHLGQAILIAKLLREK